jgi:hypothetical protein
MCRDQVIPNYGMSTFTFHVSRVSVCAETRFASAKPLGIVGIYFDRESERRSIALCGCKADRSASANEKRGSVTVKCPCRIGALAFSAYVGMTFTSKINGNHEKQAMQVRRRDESVQGNDRLSS